MSVLMAILSAYIAPHILTRLNALAKAVSKDPKHFLDIEMMNKS